MAHSAVLGAFFSASRATVHYTPTQLCSPASLSLPYYSGRRREANLTFSRKAAEVSEDLAEATEQEPFFHLVGGLSHRANELQIPPFKRKGWAFEAWVPAQKEHHSLQPQPALRSQKGPGELPGRESEGQPPGHTQPRLPFGKGELFCFAPCVWDRTSITSTTCGVIKSTPAPVPSTVRVSLSLFLPQALI